jgi:UDP-N-acetylglucosamine 4,6-dehydratase
VIGIRRGEKLHEVLISEDDARYTYDCGDKYVISANAPLPYGLPVSPDFRYSSNDNSEWLSVEELRRLVG